MEKIASSLKSFQGIKGRFEFIRKAHPVVIYDFAHNPAKIDSLLQTATSLFPSLTIFFQPHGYGPFKDHLSSLTDVFRKRLRPSDTIIFGKIFDAGGTAFRDISSSVIKDVLIKNSINAFYAEDRKKAATLIQQNYQNKETCFIVGARDRTLRDFAIELARIED